VIFRVLAQSARRRPGYLLTVLAATAAATTALAAAAGLSAWLSAALASSDALGVNLLVRPQPGAASALVAGDEASLRTRPGVQATAPWSELGEAGGRPLFATSREALSLHRAWALGGRWPAADEALAGAATGLRPDTVVATPRGPWRIVGTLTTGEALDRALLVDLATLGDGGTAASAARLPVQRFEVRAAPQQVEAVARAVEATLAGAEARPLLRVTATRTLLAKRLEWILAGAGALTALLALGTLGAASLAQLHARRRELALLFSLGYSRAWVTRLLTLELLLGGVAAWLVGALAGELLAAHFAYHLLGRGAVAVRPLSAGLTGAAAALLGTLVVLAGTALLTARRLARLHPAAVLGGR
jgi:hypothetical protein